MRVMVKLQFTDHEGSVIDESTVYRNGIPIMVPKGTSYVRPLAIVQVEAGEPQPEVMQP